MRAAAKSAVATLSERKPKNALAQLAPQGPRAVAGIEADLKKLDAKAQRIPADEPFDSPRMKAIEDDYNRLREELKEAKAKLSQQEKALDKRKMLPSPADEFRSPMALESMAEQTDSEMLRQANAASMGFRLKPLYHGTASDIDAFRLDTTQTTDSHVGRLGVSLAESPGVAEEFSRLAASKNPDSNAGANVMPVRIRGSRQGEIELDGTETNLEIAATVQDAWDAGYDLIRFTNYTTPGGKKGQSFVLVRDPSQIRSVHARFDPKKKSSANLMAGLAGLGFGASLLGDDEQMNGLQQLARGADGIPIFPARDDLPHQRRPRTVGRLADIQRFGHHRPAQHVQRSGLEHRELESRTARRRWPARGRYLGRRQL